jgi:NitT/TauT family transport system substrate-binding protein
MSNTTPPERVDVSRLLRRREFLRWSLLATSGGLAAACAPAAAPAAKPAASSAPAANAPAAAPTAASRPLTKATIGTISGVLENAFLQLGVERGLFRDAGIDAEIVEFQDGGTILRALLANEVDVMEGGPQGVFPAIEKGSAVRLIASTRPKVAFALYTRPDIQQLTDLYGKDVGIAGPGSFLHLLMLALAQERGLDADRFNFVNVGSSPSVFRAVAAQKVAAGPAGVEFLPTAEADPQNVRVLLIFDDVIPAYTRVGLVARERDLTDRADLFTMLLTGWAKSLRYGVENKEPWVDFTARKYERTRADAEWNWDYEVRNLIVDPNLDVDERAVEYMQALNVKVGSQSRILPFDQVASRQIQQRVIEQIGRWERRG